MSDGAPLTLDLESLALVPLYFDLEPLACSMGLRWLLIWGPSLPRGPMTHGLHSGPVGSLFGGLACSKGSKSS